MPSAVNNQPCGNAGNIDLGTKFMSDIMRLGDGQAWSKNILKADRAPVTHAMVLNPANRRQNTYGFLQQGLGIRPRNFQAAEPAAKEALKGWIDQLNKDFKGVSAYEPADLPKIAKNLDKAADQLVKNAECLVSQAEISPNDGQFFKNVAAGLKSAATNLRALHEAVCAGPNIEHVTLDIPAQQH